MAIVLSGSTNDITVNGVSVATDTEVSSAVAPKANTSDVNTQLSLKANTADLKEIGVGQTWQDVTASRASGVTYTNTTGKPIFISVQRTGHDGWQLYINSLIIGDKDDGAAGINPRNTLVGIVPNNGTYSVTGFTKWYELR